MLRFVQFALLALLAATSVRAQAVLVLWGDSLVCGYGADAGTGTPYGPAPFGSPLADAYRWEEEGQRWLPLTAQQNHQGTGADLAYGAAAAWRALHPSSGPVYVVALGLPGADVTPFTGRRQSSWSPLVPGGAFQRFKARYLTPALASLPAPRVEWVCGSAGNNAVTSWARFRGDLAATWSALLADLPGTPVTLMLRSYRRCDMEARIAIESAGHAVVDLDPLPLRVGGLQPDGVHLTHYGVVCAGNRVAAAALLNGPPRPPAATSTSASASVPALAPH